MREPLDVQGCETVSMMTYRTDAPTDGAQITNAKTPHARRQVLRRGAPVSSDGNPAPCRRFRGPESGHSYARASLSQLGHFSSRRFFVPMGTLLRGRFLVPIGTLLRGRFLVPIGTLYYTRALVARAALARRAPSRVHECYPRRGGCRTRQAGCAAPRKAETGSRRGHWRAPGRDSSRQE